jgi:integrase
MDAALRPLDERFGDEIAAEFGPAKLLELQEYMMGLDWSRGVINHQISRVKRFFRWCSKKEYVPKELYAGLLCVDGLQKGRFDVREADEVRPVDLHWVYKTLPHMTPTVAAMVQAQLLCGMRPAEVCAMRGCHLNARGDVWIYSPPQHKNAWRDIVRNIPIPQVAQQVIKPFLKTDLEAFLFSPQESEAWRLSQRHPSRKTDRKTKVYPSELRARETAKAARAQKPSRKRDHYDTDSYRRAITYAIDKANKAGEEIPHWHPHQLRHTISTEISQAIGEQAAQRWLGHEHLETTGIYTEKQIKELIEIAQELDRHWSRKQQAS